MKPYQQILESLKLERFNHELIPKYQGIKINLVANLVENDVFVKKTVVIGIRKNGIDEVLDRVLDEVM